MPQNFDVVIIGAGPAGLTAAIRLADKGASVLVADSSDRPGGQLVKQIHKFFGSAQVCAGVRGIRLAEQYYQEAMDKGVHFSLDSAVYDIEALPAEGYLVYADHKDGTRAFSARVVVMAMGASENAIAFPGWTLPGVITAGAAQTMVNLRYVRPGKRAVVVGSGNVGLIVSYQLMQAGMDVACIVEAAPKLSGYAVHAGKVRRAGVPILFSHTIARAEGEDELERVVIAKVDEKFQIIPGTEEVVEADTLCLSVGLSPRIELASLCGCEMTFGGPLGRVPLHNEYLETTCPNVLIAGDLSGIEEASTALDEGRLAGTRAAFGLGKLSKEAAEKNEKVLMDRISSLRSGP